MEQNTSTEVKAELVGGKDLQRAMDEAVLNSAMDATLRQENDAGSSAAAPSAPPAPPRAVSPLTGAPTPAGRPRGVKNKLTNLRDAVLEAFDKVGGVDYLVKLANGTQSDRAAFTSLMNKVLPTQINQQVDGGIRLELSWLGGRSIGTTTAQVPVQTLQVIDVERETDGSYRIKDPQLPSEGGAESPAAGGGSTPSPQNGAGGAGDA
jgi:hypothetical protein